MSLSPVDRPKRGRGRPRKGTGPNVPWDVVDRALVHGEKRVNEETGLPEIVYPTMAELGERYGVTRNRIWQYATKRKCVERRKEAEARAIARIDQKIAEKKAEAHVRASADLFQIIDAFIGRFHALLANGEVRADNPADFERLVRLKELLQGNADSRQSIQGSLSLDAIQQRHQKLRGQLTAMNPQLTGVDTEQAGPADDARDLH